MQLINIVRAHNTDHSNPLGMFHSLIFIDSEQREGNENRLIPDGDLYQIRALGRLDRDMVMRCFDEADKKKESGVKWNPKTGFDAK